MCLKKKIRISRNSGAVSAMTRLEMGNRVCGVAESLDGCAGASVLVVVGFGGMGAWRKGAA